MALGRGRPKKEVTRDRQLTLRLSEEELKMIARVSEKLRLSRTDTIVMGVWLLSQEAQNQTDEKTELN